MKRICITLCLLIFPAVATIALATTALAQTVLVGTGNPDVDVPAVQDAVDQGGEVILKGHFSFKRTPTVPTALPGYPQAMILVSKAVAISGAGEHDEMTSIEGGTIPFYVEAPGASVTIQALRFVRPTREAIFVYAASGLTVVSCKIEGVVPVNHNSDGIAIKTIISPPTPTNPGKPENISGRLLIVNNDIDMAGGTAQDNTIGVFVFSVGVPGAEVEAYVSGNNIRNVTEPAINFRRVGGRAYVEKNMLTTASVTSLLNPGPEVIRVVNSGSYLIARNSINCRWADAEAIGIGVFSQFVDWPMERAIVVDNDVTMSAPEGTVFGGLSAGIDIRGFAQGNVVLNNRIRGRARAALSVDVFKGGGPSYGGPSNNAFVLNRFDDFEASRAEVFVSPSVMDVSVMNTLIVGQGTVEDHGIGTVIVPVSSRGQDQDRD